MNFFVFSSQKSQAQSGNIIPVSNSQSKFVKAYELVLDASANNYRSNGSLLDKNLFPAYGEQSIYWVTGGENKGNFIFPDSIPDEYSYLVNETYSNYNWQDQQHLAVTYQGKKNSIAIFKSKYEADGNTLNWEALYFQGLFESYFFSDVFYFVNEDSLTSKGFEDNTELLIIPAFTVKDDDYTYYIDSIFSLGNDLTTPIKYFLSQGGKIYTEGNAAYMIEKFGFLESGSIDFSDPYTRDNDIFEISIDDSQHPVSFAADPNSNSVYSNAIPNVTSQQINKIVSLSEEQQPVIFTVSGEHSNNGLILCNLGLTTVNGIAGLESGSRQLQWTINSILTAFTSPVDVTRSARNEILGTYPVGDNAISYDRVDTFNVELLVRNLSDEAINSITIKENITPYFTFLDVVSGDSYTINGNTLTFNSVSMPSQTEKKIVFRLTTPLPDSELYEDVDTYIKEDTYIPASKSEISFVYDNIKYSPSKEKDYADLMFSSRIFADADVNWKNFLGLEYQPFKVFMIMENKSRSAAENVVYTQYIPKDVPFYWVDQSINIPILKTPGGKFVDVLKGSNDESNPDFDMDSDGHPDVWLDTTTIYPKGYTLIEEEVYWANPWNHLRSDEESFVFEDIDHDGLVAEDTDGDGIVDVEEPGDKIRVWKVTWDVGAMAGYEYYDPYCSYEIWVDPPDLVPLSAGVGYAYDSLQVDYPGMFYPNTPDIETADLSDTTWTHWMMRDDDGNIVWKQLVDQKINNYEGFTFVDTSEYQLLPTDTVLGTVPQPCREFIAVLSMGGEEIDMRNPTPTQSLYSKVDYETIFEEERVTPIRTTYTYYAPLPNPLQFEYLSNNYQIIDSTGSTVEDLPEWGNAHLIFDMDASTEYSYYWIRNVGYDVDYNDPSESQEGVEELGDGVFGYFIYEIPKGLGGYKITLPKNKDGSFNIDSIVKIDDKSFSKWIDNPNTWNEVEIWETAFSYQVYIPQLLIPPALDDDNFDGIDDWIDDRGDRFESNTGYLNDAFMLGDGQDYENKPDVPFTDEGMAGYVDSGWDIGADGEPGDDWFEKLGKTHIQIHAEYEGKGREGAVEISKGGTLVVEEIFGGSPWVIFSHVMSGFAKGVDIEITSEVSPSLVKFGIDTVCIKHTIEDINEPHNFDINFDPYHISYGYSEATITTYVGAKDPCSLIDPVISMPAILDPEYDHHQVTLVPLADPENEDLTNYPKQVEGTLLEVRIEVMNGTDDNWINTSVNPVIPMELGNTKLEMSYVAYPRPLVPSHVEGDEIIPGDQPGTFTTGWRFNQPEGEVLVKMGDTLNLLQPTRRAYFVFLFNIDASLEKGIYEIPFTISGEKRYYTGENHGEVSYAIPDAKFSIVDKDENGIVQDFEKIILEQTSLSNLKVNLTSNFTGLGSAKWTVNDVEGEDFDNLENELSVSGSEIIDLSDFSEFPSKDTTKLYILQRGIIDSYNTTAEKLVITNGQELYYNYPPEGDMVVTSNKLVVTPVGPKIKITNKMYRVNGILVSDTIQYESNEDLFAETLLQVKNYGTDVSANTVITIYPGEYYTVLEDSLPANCTYQDGLLKISIGTIIPGEKKEQILPFLISADIPQEVDIETVIAMSDIDYEGTAIDASFHFTDPKEVTLDLYDFESIEISYSDSSANSVTVTATAHNRGITATDVWFRIYPSVGEDGALEMQIAEIKIDTFKTGDKITITGTYDLPETDKPISFVAIVDDSKSYHEWIEINNSLRVTFGVSTGIDDLYGNQKEVEMYPNPFSDELFVSYYNENDLENVNIRVYDLQGRLQKVVEDCPMGSGHHVLRLNMDELKTGVYLYEITGQSSSFGNIVIAKRKMIKQ